MGLTVTLQALSFAKPTRNYTEQVILFSDSHCRFYMLAIFFLSSWASNDLGYTGNIYATFLSCRFEGNKLLQNCSAVGTSHWGDVHHAFVW